MACGATALPQAKLTDAKTSVSAAEAVGAKDEPTAGLHLKMAQDGILEAEKLIAEKDYEQATFVLERARADGDLALALTDTAEKQRSADEALTKLHDLESSMQSNKESQ